ncbi:ferric reductase NAD binding domain-containing protein [Dactylonectria estremocensis]|uniref:Ferric reductase NAD binding domain-containing protein n=1 Tax=Dactylonectria estremocensis TaxID=1079267 RepID=A0A9P9F070_9HYPO|nr:ferric reductase NAD binding domain-containing protein [Dactylonectria estremocensis]
MTGAPHMDPAFFAKIARRSQLNKEAMTIFAAMMSILAGLILGFHVLRQLGATKRTLCGRIHACAVVSRRIRSLLLHKCPGLPTVGHVFVIVAYLGINIIAAFIKFDNSNMPLLSNVASRTGWMAIANTLIVVVFSLKNTPFAVFTAWSHERLNILHRVAGFTTVAFVIVHGCSYAAVFGLQGRLSRLTEIKEIFGLIAGFSFLCVGFAGAVVRNWLYELFYYLHVTFWMLGMVMVGLHQPESSRPIVYITITTAGIWVLDRCIRLLRLAINGVNNTVTLTPLPHGGTRLVFSKQPCTSFSGRHSFLWIPSISALQTHPFTIVAIGPFEFVIAAHDGFTRALHNYAVRNPGASLRASVEGPYGTFPNPREHDKVILVAGGSGASFTVGVARSILEQNGGDEKSIVFIWMIKHHAYLTWFSEHLKILKGDPRVSVHVYVTRSSMSEGPGEKPPSSSESSSGSSSQSTSPTPDPEKPYVSRLSIPLPTATTDMEKSGVASPVESPTSPISPLDAAGPGSDFSIIYRRPNVAALIRAGIEGVPSDKRVLVMGCGPQTLMTTVRNATAEFVRPDSAGVELHCEQFGW